MPTIKTLITEGFEELEKKLLTLGETVQRKVVRKSLNRASTTMTRAMRKAAPVGDTKRFKKSVKKHLFFDRFTSVLTAEMGSRSPLAHIVEFGSNPRFTASGKSTGVSPPNPFIRRTWDTHIASVLAKMKAELGAGIEAAGRK